MKLYYVLLTLFSLHSVACGKIEEAIKDQDWELSDVKLEMHNSYYPAITGKIKKLDMDETSAEVEYKYYSDEYKTLIKSDYDWAGMDTSKDDPTQTMEVYSLYVFLKPASDGLDKVCVRYRLQKSNVPDWTDLGCLEGTEEEAIVAD